MWRVEHRHMRVTVSQVVTTHAQKSHTYGPINGPFHVGMLVWSLFRFRIGASESDSRLILIRAGTFSQRVTRVLDFSYFELICFILFPHKVVTILVQITIEEARTTYVVELFLWYCFLNDMPSCDACSLKIKVLLRIQS